MQGGTRGGRRRRAHQPAGDELRFRRPQRAGRFAGDVIRRAPLGTAETVPDRSCSWTTTPRTSRSSIRRSKARAIGCSPRKSGKDAIAIARARRAGPDPARRHDAGHRWLRDVRPPEGRCPHARLRAIIFLSALTEAQRQGAGPGARRRRFRQQAVPGGGSARHASGRT